MQRLQQINKALGIFICGLIFETGVTFYLYFLKSGIFHKNEYYLSAITGIFIFLISAFFFAKKKAVLSAMVIGISYWIIVGLIALSAMSISSMVAKNYPGNLEIIKVMVGYILGMVISIPFVALISFIAAKTLGRYLLKREK